MICPNCEYEYVDSVKVCPDCNIELVPVEEFEGKLVHHSDWVVVHTSAENYDMENLKANLKGADIEAIILGQKDRNFPGVGDLAVFKLLVKKSEAADALQIIEDIYRQRDEEGEESGEENE